jgi:hypothetical protein
MNNADGTGRASMDFRPVVQQLGNQAAQSVGTPNAKHGPTDHISLSVSPAKHSAEADVFYRRSASSTGVRQLRELELHTHNGRETVRRTWY